MTMPERLKNLSSRLASAAVLKWANPVPMEGPAVCGPLLHGRGEGRMAATLRLDQCLRRSEGPVEVREVTDNELSEAIWCAWANNGGPKGAGGDVALYVDCSTGRIVDVAPLCADHGPFPVDPAPHSETEKVLQHVYVVGFPGCGLYSSGFKGFTWKGMTSLMSELVTEAREFGQEVARGG